MSDWIETWPNWLRWVLFFPLACLAVIALNMVVALDLFVDSPGRWLSLLVAPSHWLAGGGLFVLAGALVAPAAHKWVAFGMGCVVATYAAWLWVMAFEVGYSSSYLLARLPFALAGALACSIAAFRFDQP